MYFPDFSMRSATGPIYGRAMGEPATGTNDPSALMVNSEIALSILFAVYKNPPPGAMTIPAGSFPVIYGEVGSADNGAVGGVAEILMENASMAPLFPG